MRFLKKSKVRLVPRRRHSDCLAIHFASIVEALHGSIVDVWRTKSLPRYHYMMKRKVAMLDSVQAKWLCFLISHACQQLNTLDPSSQHQLPSTMISAHHRYHGSQTLVQPKASVSTSLYARSANAMLSLRANHSSPVSRPCLNP